MDRMSFFKRIKKIIEEAFKLECPNCGGKMDCIFIDMFVDKCVYKCRDCGKEWI